MSLPVPSAAFGVSALAIGAIALGIAINNTSEINSINNNKGGGVFGPHSSTINAIPTWVNSNGNLLQDTLVTLTSDGKFTQTNNHVSIDMSTPEVLNLIATAVQINGVDLHSVFLSLSGGSMQGNINMNSHLITNVSNLILTTGQNAMQADFNIGANSITNNIGNTIEMFHADTINLKATNVQVNGIPIATSSSLNAFLRLDGTSTMSGNLNLGGHNILNAANVMTGPGSSVVNNFSVFSTTGGNVLKDSGINQTQLELLQWTHSSLDGIPSPTPGPHSLLTDPVAGSTMIFAPNTTQRGTCVYIHISGEITLDASESITVNATVNGVSIVSVIFTEGSGSPGTEHTNLDVYFQPAFSTGFGQDVMAASVSMSMNGKPANIQMNAIPYDYTIQNTFDVTGTWSTLGGGYNSFVANVTVTNRL